MSGEATVIIFVMLHFSVQIKYSNFKSQNIFFMFCSFHLHQKSEQRQKKIPREFLSIYLCFYLRYPNN